MIANPRFDAGRFSATADDAVSVLLEEGLVVVGRQLFSEIIACELDIDCAQVFL